MLLFDCNYYYSLRRHSHHAWKSDLAPHFYRCGVPFAKKSLGRALGEGFVLDIRRRFSTLFDVG